MSFMKRGLLFVACLVGLEAAAQGFSPAAMEQLKMKRLWFHSQNAAGAVYDDTQNYSDVVLGYNMQDGNFYRPQEGDKVSTVGVSSEGFMNLGNAFVWGAFKFSQDNLTDAGYNASITDPFRGMPYYVADTHLSKWRNQFYDLQFRASTPLVGKDWTLGIAGKYQASLAAKQRDPRVDTRFYTLELQPGVTCRVSDSHRFGLNFTYASIKEDSRMSNSDTDTSQKYYILYGLGNAVEYVGSGFTHNYIGDRFGVNAQFNYNTSSFNLLFEGGYDVKAETVQQTYDKPKKIAGVKDKTAKFSLTAYKQSKNYTNYFKLSFVDRNMDGIQFVSQWDTSDEQKGWIELHKNIRSSFKTQVASFNYILTRDRGNEYNWKVEAGVTYVKNDDEYFEPNSIKNAENLTFNLGGKKNFVLDTKLNSRLLLDIHAAYNNNLNGEYVYGGNNKNEMVTELEQGLAEYQMCDYYRIGGSLTYSQQVKEDARINMFGKLAFDYVGTSDYDYDKRTYLSVSLGCNF